MIRALLNIFFTIGLFVNVLRANAQERPFLSGESLHYKAIYCWGLIWLEAGEVTFSVAPKVVGCKPMYVLRSSGQSLPSYDWIYKVRDRFESIVDSATLKPYSFVKESLEGGLKVYNHYSFNYKTNNLLVQSQTSFRRKRTDTLDIKLGVLDVLTAVYYARCLDYSQLFVGQKIFLNLAIDNEIVAIYGRYLGKERLVLRDGRIFNTIKFSVLMVDGTIFKGGEDLLVWISDDRNKVPIMVEAKILVGKVRAILQKAEGLKYNFTSQVLSN
jgi:Protein of unknown function (DUF3108).